MKFRYRILRRLAQTALVVVGVVTLTFFLTRVMPSDPAAIWAGQHASAEEIAKARVELGLDQPLYVQYVDFLFQIAQGDLGRSIRTKRAVVGTMIQLFPATLELVILSMLIATVVGVPLGILSAQNQDTWIDHIGRVFAMSGVSIPVFWLGMILQVFVAGWLLGLPLQGRVSDAVVSQHPLNRITGMLLLDSLLQFNIPVFLSGLRHMILPSVTLSLPPLAIISRMSRSAMLETLQEEYIDVHLASGIPQRTVLYKLALKNSLNSVLTVIGLSFGYLLGASVLVESVFSWPGLGRFMVQSILAVDMPAVIGVTLVFATTYTLINMFVDISYAWINPRIRTGGGGE